jgi:hypothetical protein
VAGESHYLKQLRSLFGKDFKPGGTEIEARSVGVERPG